jgi:hypothetical protein
MGDDQTWWKKKVGRPRLYETPEELLSDCEDYLTETSNRKWIKKDWVGKDAIPVDRETDAPFTMTGLYVFLDIDPETWANYRKREEFFGVCTRIERIITTQKVEGAAVGAYNANIVSRLEGLADRKEVEKKVTKLNFKDAE